MNDDRAWPELARAIVEADFAAAEALTDERQQSRRLLATLRFLRHLVEIDNEADLGACHRASRGGLVRRRCSNLPSRSERRVRPSHGASWRARRGGRQASAIPLVRGSFRGRFGSGRSPNGARRPRGPRSCSCRLSIGSNPDWVLALIGTFPKDAESLFAVLGRIVGVQLETIRSKRRDRTREQFESLLGQGGAVPELVAVGVVRELADMTGAAYASLVLNRQGLERRLVSIGTSSEIPGTVHDGSTGRALHPGADYLHVEAQ